MAINKTINKRTNTHGAMRNCIEWILLISVSSIAVIGDVVRKYFPINLILLLGFINIAAMEIKIYCHNKMELY